MALEAITMSALKFGAPKKGVVKVYKGGECVAWLHNHGERWTLSHLEDALTKDDRVLIRAYARERFVAL